jgi:hypothetical protein
VVFLRAMKKYRIPGIVAAGPADHLCPMSMLIAAIKGELKADARTERITRVAFIITVVVPIVLVVSTLV